MCYFWLAQKNRPKAALITFLFNRNEYLVMVLLDIPAHGG